MTVRIENFKDYHKIIFKNDPENNNLRLLVILSPIFIASFDNTNGYLTFLRSCIDKSKFTYGLYPNFFNNFSISDYKKSYESYLINEDIYLRDDGMIEFRINILDEKFLVSLISLIEAIIIDRESNYYFTNYFMEIRDDIVINGRRSILANGIQGFYLSKYVLVWMLDLCDYIFKNKQSYIDDIRPIYELANNMQTPGFLQKKDEL